MARVKTEEMVEEAVVLTKFDARPKQATRDAWAGVIREVQDRYKHFNHSEAAEESE